MPTKAALLAALRDVFQSWDERLAGLDPHQAVQAQADGWSVHDVVAHLKAWQEISVARLEAALQDREPIYPAWLGGADPFAAEEDVDTFNARIVHLHRDRPWPELYREWREGFLRLLALADALPEEALSQTNRYPWLRGHPLAAVLTGTLEHHREHLAQAFP